MPPSSEPQSEKELVTRARNLAGLRLGELGAQLGVEVPDEAVRAKGIAGQILEKALGATAGSRAEPDFVGLGIELKTIPLDAAGKPNLCAYLDRSTDQYGRENRDADGLYTFDEQTGLVSRHVNGAFPKYCDEADGCYPSSYFPVTTFLGSACDASPEWSVAESRGTCYRASN